MYCICTVHTVCASPLRGLACLPAPLDAPAGATACGCHCMQDADYLRKQRLMASPASQQDGAATSSVGSGRDGTFVGARAGLAHL